MTGSGEFAEGGKVCSVLKNLFPSSICRLVLFHRPYIYSKTRMCASLNKEDTQFLEIYL